MFRPLLVCLVVALNACGPLGPPKADGGAGGGGSLFGGGTGGNSGGGSGGGVTGGGTGGGSTGGGTGGGGVTGGGTGGGSTGGGGGAVGPLTWANVSIGGVTSSSYIIAISGTANDLWAAQDTGYVFHSAGGAFSLQFPIQYGVKDLYANGGTVVLVQGRSIRTCTANCTTDTAFADYSLISPYNLTAEAACGRGPNDITVIVSDTQNMAQVFQWNGTMWTRTNSNLGIAYPRACWFDEGGVLYVAGQDEVARSDSGATTIETLSNNLSTYYSGASVGGTQWVVGQGGYIGRRNGTTWTKVTGPSTSILWAVGGLSANELYAFGYWDSTAGNGVKWNGTTLSSAGNLLPGTGSQSTIRAMLVTGPNEIYAVGNNQSGPIIVRGRR